MKRFSIFITIILLVCALFFTTASASTELEIDDQKIVGSGTACIVFTANSFGHVQENNMEGEETLGYAALKGFIDKETKEASGKLVLDGGNAFGGSAFAIFDQGKAVAQIISSVDYDAIMLGDYDLNYNQAALSALKKEAGVEFLSTNIKKDGQALFAPSFIKKIGGIKIGVIGVTSPQAAESIHNWDNLDYGTEESIIADVQATIQSLQADGVQIIIAITRLKNDSPTGFTVEKLIKQTEGLDYIFDVSFDNVGDGSITSTGKTIVFRIKEDLSQIAMLTIKNSEGKLSLQPQIFDAADLLPKITDDTPLNEKIKQMAADRQQVLQKTVFVNPVGVLDGSKETILAKESNLTRLITSAYQEAAGADIALLSGNEIKSSLYEGTVTKGQILEAVPFSEDVLVTQKIPGSIILEALKEGLDPQKESFLHGAGLAVTYRDAGAEREIVKVLVDGKKLDADQEYLVAMSNFLARGGDGFSMFASTETAKTFDKIDSVVTDYFTQITDKQILDNEDEVRFIAQNADSVGWFPLILVVVIIAAAIVAVVFIIKKRK
ncbi:MAG: bifunctional metallophosphatase/5'-nucleotidase [Bacillota bacterium]|jgi:5'-nucleotidase/UDP-sugar diphosphatase